MDWMMPMSPILRNTIEEGSEWIHQVKWDGIRGLCYMENGRLRVFTKRGRERTGFYPELEVLSFSKKVSSLVLDGELVVLDSEGKPSFHLSLTRERLNSLQKTGLYASKYPAKYVLFDIIALNGQLLTSWPLTERSLLLKELIRPSANIALTDDFEDGHALFALMKEKGWEGIVSKRLMSFYSPGKNHTDWYKVKLVRKLLAAIAGITLKESFPNALILAVNRGDGWEYIGKAAVGLTHTHLALLKDVMNQLKSEKNPFGIQHPDFKNALWIEINLTCWAGFLEWTQDGALRHPKILGFSDQPPSQATGKEFVE